MKIFKITLYVLGIIALAIIGASFYMVNFALNANNDKDVDSVLAQEFNKYEHLEPWLDSLKTSNNYCDTFVTFNGKDRLHAIYVKATPQTNRCAVLLHGYKDCYASMLMLGYMYNHDFGYNILIPDHFAHGLSDGNIIQMGWKDRLNAMKWMDIANHVFGDSTQMVVHGISMGGATTMMISGETQKPYVKCFVDDCGYTDVWSQFSNELHNQFGLPNFPLLYTANILCNIRYGWSFKEASAIEQVKRCTLPMMFIHGSDDSYVVTDMVYQLYEAKQGDKELWIAPDSKHAKSYFDHQTEYANRVKLFVDKYIK